MAGVAHGRVQARNWMVTRQLTDAECAQFGANPKDITNVFHAGGHPWKWHEDPLVKYTVFQVGEFVFD